MAPSVIPAISINTLSYIMVGIVYARDCRLCLYRPALCTKIVVICKTHRKKCSSRVHSGLPDRTALINIYIYIKFFYIVYIFLNR